MALKGGGEAALRGASEGHSTGPAGPLRDWQIQPSRSPNLALVLVSHQALLTSWPAGPIEDKAV